MPGQKNCISVAEISVIIPVYNGENSIARAVHSALAQDFSDFEIIVVDDGSTDSTPRVLSQYGDRIRILRQANRGSSAARNAGAVIANGKYLAFLDADDWWRKDKLTLMHQALEINENAILAFSGYWEVFPDRTHSKRLYEKAPSFDDMFKRRVDIPPSTVLMRRSGFERCGRFCKELPHGCEDTYLWLVAREHGPFIYVNESLISISVRASYCQKYRFVGARKFNRIVLTRYGRRGLPIIHQNNKDLAYMALQEAATQLRLKRPIKAVKWWIEAARVRPQDAFGRIMGRVCRAGAGIARRFVSARV
jgi:glycosyltransferase involved in cell wall biosynthesis